MNKVFALVDCNNFFVSCERLFDPKLKNIPVVVLSNNDGCVVARSNEAKIIGIKMGEPIFKCKDIIDFFNVKTLSSNFALYKDISRRVMNVLSSFSKDMQIYSVDEAFLELTHLNISSYEKFGEKIRDAVYKEVGIPVSVGISSTKTLAKVASKCAKKRDGVFCIFKNREKVLKTFPVEDVWGIGRAISKRLYNIRIYTVKEFLTLSPKYISKEFSVLSEKTYWELSGISVIDLHSSLDTPKTIMYTRSFKQGIKNKDTLRRKIASFTSSLTRSLRLESLVCGGITIFISGNRFKEGYIKKFKEIKLDNYSNLEKEIVKKALESFEEIYVPNNEYKRAGVIISNIKREKDYTNLFLRADEKNISCQKSVDEINERWPGIVKLSSEELNSKEEKENVSLRYTTNWEELPSVF